MISLETGLPDSGFSNFTHDIVIATSFSVARLLVVCNRSPRGDYVNAVDTPMGLSSFIPVGFFGNSRLVAITNPSHAVGCWLCLACSVS